MSSVGVTVLPQKRNPLDDVIAQAMSEFAAQRRQREVLDAQESQFSRSHEQDKLRTAALVKESGAGADAQTANANKTKDEMLASQGQRIFGGALKQAENLWKQGEIDKGTEYLMTALKSIDDRLATDVDPDAQKIRMEIRRATAQYFTTPPDTAAAETQRNLGEITKDATGNVVGGTQNAQDRNVVNNLLFNRDMPEQVFTDQQAREVGVQPQAVRVKTDIEPGATAKLKADTDIKTTGMQTASAERQAAARIAADAARPTGVTGSSAAAGPKPLSGEASKVLAIATTIQPEIEQLKAAFRDDYRGTLLGMTTGTDRTLVKLRDNIADKLGRLRSGGAINKDEEKRFIRQIGGVGDLAFGNSEDAISALDGILNEARSVERSIRPSDDPLGILD